MNLPTWPGADVAYSRAYALLDHMARNGQVSRTWGRGGWKCYPSPEMRDLIEALDNGDEEKIKGTLLQNLKWGTR